MNIKPASIFEHIVQSVFLAAMVGGMVIVKMAKIEPLPEIGMLGSALAIAAVWHIWFAAIRRLANEVGMMEKGQFSLLALFVAPSLTYYLTTIVLPGWISVGDPSWTFPFLARAFVVSLLFFYVHEIRFAK